MNRASSRTVLDVHRATDTGGVAHSCVDLREKQCGRQDRTSASTKMRTSPSALSAPAFRARAIPCSCLVDYRRALALGDGGCAVLAVVVDDDYVDLGLRVSAQTGRGGLDGVECGREIFLFVEGGDDDGELQRLEYSGYYSNRSRASARRCSSRRCRRATVRSPRVRSRMPRTISVLRRRPRVTASG